METGTIALLISGGLLALQVFDRIWGGASGLSAKFTKLEKDLTSSISELRKDLLVKHDNSTSNVGDAMRGLTQRIHDMELGQAKFEAAIAKDYMRRDSYYTAMNEVKADMRKGFEDLSGQIADIREKVITNMVEHARSK